MNAGCGVSAQPKLTIVPDTVWPAAGVSIIPNGTVDVELDAVNVRPGTDPSQDPRHSIKNCAAQAIAGLA
jgi:hypothetical protein